MVRWDRGDPHKQCWPIIRSKRLSNVWFVMLNVLILSIAKPQKLFWSQLLTNDAELLEHSQCRGSAQRKHYCVGLLLRRRVRHLKILLLVAFKVLTYFSLFWNLKNVSGSGSHKSISYLVSVDVVQSIKQHLHDFLDLCQGELDIGIAQQPSQVMFTEVKYQVDAAFVSVVLSSFKSNDRGKK